jgi:hypothetical protein
MSPDGRRGAGASPPRLRAMTAERLLAWLLRLGAVLTLPAFATALLPAATMAAVHRDLGLGELVVTPAVDYMARSLSLLYGFHGGLMLLLSFHVRRLAPVVVYLGAMNVVLGAALLAIDLHAGLPGWWVAAEGPPVIGVGVLLLALVRAASR